MNRTDQSDRCADRCPLHAPARHRKTSGQSVLDWKTVGRVAQVVEQRPFKAWVAGSNPAALTNLKSAQSGPPREGLMFFVRGP
jgi:hypothetical protein